MRTWPATREMTEDLSLDSHAAGSFVADPALASLASQYPELRPSLLRFLIRQGVDFRDAEDVMQDTFLKLLRRRTTGTIDNLFQWLCTSARNLAITRYHRARRESLASAERWEQYERTVADSDPGALAAIQQREAFVALARAFAGLSRREQRCMILRSQGVTFRETAAELGISLRSAVYSTGSALRKLHRELHSSDL